MEGVQEVLLRHSERSDQEDLPDFPRVTFLGTGSSSPGKYRNVSGVLVEVEEDKFMLLDCGEGER